MAHPIGVYTPNDAICITIYESDRKDEVLVSINGEEPIRRPVFDRVDPDDHTLNSVCPPRAFGIAGMVIELCEVQHLPFLDETVKTRVGWEKQNEKLKCTRMDFNMYCQPGDLCDDSLVRIFTWYVPSGKYMTHPVYSMKPVCLAQRQDGKCRPLYRKFSPTSQTDDSGEFLWIYEGLRFRDEDDMFYVD